MQCHNCGADLEPGKSFCKMCGYQTNAATIATVADRASTAEGNTATIAAVVAQAPIAQGSDNGSVNLIRGTSIALGDGESVWREYAVTQLRKREQGEGTLYVTDSRIIFFAKARGRGSGRASMLIQQTKIEHVTGLSAYVSRKVSLFWFAATAILGLATLFELSRGSWTPFIVLLVLTAGAVYLLVRGAARRGASVSISTPGRARRARSRLAR